MSKYKKFKKDIIYLITAFLVVIISFVGSYYDPNDNNIWFARSGAIMVLLAVIVEYRLNNMTLKIISRKVDAANKFKSTIKLTNSKYHNNVAKVAHIFVVLGTLIWGYGDFIVK